MGTQVDAKDHGRPQKGDALASQGRLFSSTSIITTHRFVVENFVILYDVHLGRSSARCLRY